MRHLCFISTPPSKHVDQPVARDNLPREKGHHHAEIFPDFDLKTITDASLADFAQKFPQFLPKKIRKDTAAFYTAVWAADLLAELAVVGSETMICDPACGTGQLLLSAVKSIHSRGKENGRIQVYGSEVNPFAAKVAGTVINPWVRNSSTENREDEEIILEGA